MKLPDAAASQNAASKRQKPERPAWGLSRFWWVILSFWVVVSLASALEISLLHTISRRQVLLETLARLIPWIFMTLLVVRLSSVYMLDRVHWKRALPVYLAACAASLGMVAVFTYWGPPPVLVDKLTPAARSMDFLVLVRVTYQLPTFWGLVAVAHAIRFYERENLRKLHEAELRAQLIQARLQALQWQLNPHFLFNTLNSIASLVHDRPATAEKMIEALGELLRLAITTTDRQQVTVREELRLLDQYLFIQRIRFGERLQVETQIDETVFGDQVPALILQPLVENAVKHGLENQLGPCRILIAAQSASAGNCLRLEVSDNGPALNTSGEKIAERVGLTNTRARLLEMFGPQAILELIPGRSGGFVTRILIPRPTAASFQAVSLPGSGAAL